MSVNFLITSLSYGMEDLLCWLLVIDVLVDKPRLGPRSVAFSSLESCAQHD
jgi:hypothetical protein